ncbi:MAG: prepilin-type N-terminal cleavage/methylation domain-containing protein [Candidatus Brocadiae bacterium]|nr:prepilin-type N-terminal cleavage/methylation domain-containing protein [Candidatus Brocadiia bacterium]
MCYRFCQSKGFTLLEILLAMVIFLLGSVSVLSLFVFALDLHRDAIEEQKIASMAQSILAELKGVDVLYGLEIKNIEGIKCKNFPDYTYDVLFKDIGNNALWVDLRIYYKRYDKKQEFSFQTVFYRHLPQRQ